MSGHDADEPESDSERRTTNIALVVAAVLFIGTGVWLVDALLKARKADECMSAGRRNCIPADSIRR